MVPKLAGSGLARSAQSAPLIHVGASQTNTRILVLHSPIKSKIGVKSKALYIVTA